MKKLAAFFLLLMFFIPSPAYANGAGLPAFFKVNGQLSIPNPLQLYGITASTFLIPQDFTAQNYVINEPINFEIDEEPLKSVITDDALKNTKYTWDYGDGEKAEGLKNTHTYTKIGSYILVLTINIYTNDGYPPTQFVDSFLLNILPDKNYNLLPKAHIKINGESVADPTQSELNDDFTQVLSFDASASTSNTQIVQYLWNFGDGQTSTSSKATHVYNKQDAAIVVLRVKDSNGFISDDFVGLNNSSAVKKAVQPVSSTTNNKPYILVFGLIFIGLISWWYLRFYRRGKKII